MTPLLLVSISPNAHTCLQWQNTIKKTLYVTDKIKFAEMTVQHTSALAAHHTKRKKDQALNSRSTKRTRTAEGRRNANTEAPKRLRKANAEEDRELKRARSETNKNNTRVNVGDNNRTTTSTSTNRKARNFGRPTYKC